ncbi:competence type IV pilus minor pilin ComGF [Priestia koreensis]|uniref:competence type IV pilus minor pilin ComGF n=1 Tax=Priestia koreensis TaxID=284581 RepID=UPI001F57F358|nr:competence type IV pilus minor pilin ComGF [Priestia koreensis]MCM3002457.1 prepilin-type N-terminal cleavage/methylation domain-containing protein [Priestia koreensis]UNL87341.1 prepilin-type N-terminal cleavage/methylation domain-containing protein [Priestia koreensis]
MKNQKGFTLLEMLISLSLFSFLIAFQPLLMNLIKQFHQADETIELQEWEIFIQQLTFDLREATEFRIQEQKLLLITKDNLAVTYERYGNKARRQVDGRGHEIVLQGIKTIVFSRSTAGITVATIALDDRHFKQRISSFVGG